MSHQPTTKRRRRLEWLHVIAIVYGLALMTSIAAPVVAHASSESSHA